MTEEQAQQFLAALGSGGFVRRNQYLMACCPIHHETNPSFGLNLAQAEHPWNCFVCGGGKSIITLAQKSLVCSRREAEIFVNRFGSYALPEETENYEKQAPEDYSEQIMEMAPRVKSYRGFSRRTILKANIRLDVLENRVLIPWRGPNGQIKGVTSHNLVPGQVKALPLYGFERSKILYRCPEFSPVRSLILVEGPQDCLKVYEAGFRECAAVGSARISRDQVAEIRKLGITQITAMMDNDSAGMQGMEYMQGRMPEIVFFWACYAAKDPFLCTHEQIRESINSATYLIRR